MKQPSIRKKSAFSLIELSIVLIIIGLLIAGVTGGQSLIRNSELRSVMSEARAFATSTSGFYNQFGMMPGDYNVALGSASVGDGDGRIEYANATVSESRAAWMQMKAANILDSGVISKDVAATALSTSAVTVPVFGADIPASKLKGSGWDFDYNATNEQNVIVFTGPIASATAADTLVNGTLKSSAAITAADALSIDTKLDDGLIASGRVRGVLATCVSSGVYATASSGKVCALSYQIDL